MHDRLFPTTPWAIKAYVVWPGQNNLHPVSACQFALESMANKEIFLRHLAANKSRLLTLRNEIVEGRIF